PYHHSSAPTKALSMPRLSPPPTRTAAPATPTHASSPAFASHSSAPRCVAPRLSPQFPMPRLALSREERMLSISISSYFCVRLFAASLDLQYRVEMLWYKGADAGEWDVAGSQRRGGRRSGEGQ